MDFDIVLEDVGSFGLYQKLVISMLMPAVLPCAFHAYSQLFIASTPNHWCRVPELEQWNADVPELLKSLSIPMVYRDGQMIYSQCEMYARNYTEIVMMMHTMDKDTLSTKGEFYLEPVDYTAKNYEIIKCKDGWIYDRSMFPNTVVMEWNLVCDRGFYPTLALVLFGVGGLVGNYLYGFLQDYWGRRPSFFVYLLLEIVACALSSMTWNFPSWLIFRVVVGFTVPAILASPYVLAIELVGPRHRVLCTIVLNIAYSIGLVLLAVIVYFVRDWRYISLTVSLPLLILFTCFFILPESPRWLIATGKYRRAARIMKVMSRVNRKQIPDNYEEILRMHFDRKVTTATTTTTTPSIDPSIDNAAKKNESSHSSIGVLDLFRTPNMRAKTLIITFIWFSNTCVYVGLSYYAPALGGDEIWNFFLAGVVELPTYLFLWPGLSCIGRRWILCVSMLVGGVACLLTFLVQEDKVIMLSLYCIGKMGISSAFVVLPLAASELYPTVVRGLGMSISSVIGMIGPIVIPIINYTGSNMLVLPLIIMGCLLTIGGIASLFLPETRSKPLPQTIEDGENVPLTNPFNLRCFRRKSDRRPKIELNNVEQNTK